MASKNRGSIVVDLVTKADPREKRGFSLGQAEALLRASFDTGWMLPEDSPYVFKDGYLAKKPKKQAEE